MFCYRLFKILEIKDNQNTDPNAPNRKRDHIELAFKSKVLSDQLDKRFIYEPMLGHHPDKGNEPFNFLGCSFDNPIWVSSMTGGTELAGKINKNLAMACKEFGLGMGLGSCRSLLESDEYLPDFDVRKYIGEQALYANLGIAQVEQLVEENKLSQIINLLDKLSADGLIIHVNPLQEWLQPEGDRIRHSPVRTINAVLEKLDLKVIVKEVGQGFGMKSMKALLQLPLQAIEFSAAGGTNFSNLELMRSSEDVNQRFSSLGMIGHSANEMIEFYNKIEDESLKIHLLCKEVIISGGIRDFLDGYYAINKIKANAIYGQASAMLKHAKENYDDLRNFIQSQVDGLNLAKQMLVLR